jgi:dCTP diphosphatase
VAQRHVIQSVKADSDIRALSQCAKAFADERDWEQFHDPKNLAMALASEVGELVSVLRWTPSSAADAFARAPQNFQRITEELGDIGILLLLLCDRVGTTLDDVVIAKLRINNAKYPADLSRGRSEPPA